MNKKLLQVGFITTVVVLTFITTAYAIDFGQGTVFLSEAGGGNITFAADISADNVTWASNRVIFANFTYDTYWWNYSFGIRSPNTSLAFNITDVNATHIVIDITQSSNTTYEVYLPSVTQPNSVIGVISDNYIASVQYFTMGGNGTVIISWLGGNYTINLYALNDEVEEDMYALLYATCINGGTQHEDNVTFTIDGVGFTWNTYTDRYEGIVRRTTPTTVTFDTINAFSDSEDPSASATVNQTVTVTWTLSAQTTILGFMQVGDYTGAAISLFTQTIGGLLFNTFIITAISLAIYNYTGPEATLLAWILGWGLFSSVVHGSAVMFGIIMLAIGGGLILAKILIDRRTA